MRYQKNVLTRFLWCISGYFGIGILILFSLYKGLKTEYPTEYLIISVSYFIVGGLFFWNMFRYKIDIFQPFILISILYLCLFTFTPLIFILNNTTSVHGVNVMGGAVKATIIYILSYCSFLIGYNVYKIKYRNKKYTQSYNYSEYKRNKVVLISFLIWIFCFLCGLLYLFSIGRQFLQILTFGFSGSTQIQETGSLMKFLMNFSYGMIVPCVFLCFYSRKRLLKILVVYFSLAVYFSNGFRYIILILLVAIIITFYRKRGKLPSIKMRIVGGVLCLIFIGILGFVRNDLRAGNNIELSSFSLNHITYALESNFDIYKTFYGIVETYPKDYNYTFGKAIFRETLEMFIPRAIWPYKSSAFDASVVLAIRRSTSDFVIMNAAMATPNLGEFYVDFGIVGCIIFMFLFGIIAKWTTKFYFIPNNNLDYIILYSVMLPTFMQLIIRGYTPSNFYLIIFLLLPFVLIRFLVDRVKL